MPPFPVRLPIAPPRPIYTNPVVRPPPQTNPPIKTNPTQGGVRPPAPTTPGTSNPGVAPGATPPVVGSDPKPGFFSSGIGAGLSSGAQMAAGTIGAGWLLNAFTGKDTTGLGAIGGGIGEAVGGIGSGLGEAVGGIGEGLGDVASGAGSAMTWLPMMAVAGVGLYVFMELRKK